MRTTCLLVVALLSCKQTETISAAAPTAVSIATPSSTVSVGGTMTLTATASANGVPLSGVTPSWSSSDAAIATVNSAGLVTGVSRGTATISATVGTARGSAPITVIGLKSITLAPTALTLVTGQSVTLSATLDADPGVTATVSWSTSNAAIATVSGTGAVTAVGAGAALITATSLGRSVTANVMVIVPTVASVSISPSTASLITGQTQQFTAVARDSNGTALTGRTVTWSTSNATLATISNNGLLTAAGPGTVTVQASVDGRTGTATATIAPTPVVTLTLSTASATILVGRGTVLRATPKDRNGGTLTGRPVTWRSSNAAVASVDAAGAVTGVTTGSAVITAECDGLAATAAITVTQTQVASLTGSFGITVGAGDTASLYFVPQNASGQVVTDEEYAIGIDGSEISAGATRCDAEGCLQGITTRAFANLDTTFSVTRTLTIRPSAVPAGQGPNTQITVTLLGTMGDSLNVSAGQAPFPRTLLLNTQYPMYPFLYYRGGNSHLRNAEYQIVLGSATLRRCLQGTGTQNYQSHCMNVTPTATGTLSILVRQKKADGTFWSTTLTVQVVP